MDWLDSIAADPPLLFFLNESPLKSCCDFFPLMDIFVHIWPALQGDGRNSTSFTEQYAICDGATLKKKVGFSRWNKSSKREEESIMPMKILIYSVT